MRQANQGATVACNTGAQAALGELLVFLDDDICLQPQTLAELAASIAQWPDCLIMGRPDLAADDGTLHLRAGFAPDKIGRTAGA